MVYVRKGDLPDVKGLRKRLGMTQEEFALSFGFTVHAVREWEYGRRWPRRHIQSLLRIIDADPEMVKEVVFNMTAAGEFD